VADLYPIAVDTDCLDLGRGTERAQRITLGKKLSKQRDRVVGNYRITESGVEKRATKWRLVSTRKVVPGE
jgi:hypothetical protein